MEFKWPANKVINRYGFLFQSTNNGLLSIDIDNLRKRTVVLDDEWKEITEREAISKDEKAQLLTALKNYWFSTVVATK